jgi:hypothetical protein
MARPCKQNGRSERDKESVLKGIAGGGRRGEERNQERGDWMMWKMI